jgi:photosystem II stability/assembly factor-like uncharacterized protein
MLLADVGGRVVTSTDGGVHWTAAALEQPMPLTGLVATGEDRVALVGPRGAAATRLKTP